MPNDIVNLGVLAHVDAGKTTLTEQMLLAGGKLLKAGSVDKGTSITDSLDVERERGISVRLATASFNWKAVKVNLIDTPGHIDFCAEVERSLPALDAAILVISAVEGIQGHTISLFNALQTLKIPTLIVINKIDRVGSDVSALISDIRVELSQQCVPLQSIVNQGEDRVAINGFWSADYHLKAFQRNMTNSCYNQLLELIVEQNESLLEGFLEGEVLTYSRLNNQLIYSTSACDIFPILATSAKNTIGIEQLMDAIVEYLPKASNQQTEKVNAIVFKVEHDENLGKLVHLRILSGILSPKDVINNCRLNIEEKVSLLKQLDNGKLIAVKQLLAGDIGIVSGFSLAKIGDIYGQNKTKIKAISLSAPLLTVQVKPVQIKDYSSLVAALKILSDEDPLLNLSWLPQIQELHLNITGKIQIEILGSLLKDRFNLDVNITKPSIIYKETPADTGFGYERYWMPKPCWAILKLKIEPGERGSGVVFSSLVGVNNIAMKYQNEIAQTLEPALKQGIKGWQVTDIKVTLVEGEDHNVHSRAGDYIIATPMAIMNGLVETDTTLLEPIMSFSIIATNDLLGAITSDITKMRGEFEPPKVGDKRFLLKGKFPAATSLEYPIELASLSGGKAKITTRFECYKECALSQGNTRAYKGISPLDRDKWILQARGAIK